MNRFTLTLIAAVMTGGLLFAGGNSEKAKDQGSVTLKYGFWGNPDAIGVEEDIINAFEAENPSIKIEPVVSAYNDYHTKLLTLMAGGMAPDVMRIDSYYFQDFTKMNALIPIDDLVKKDGLDLSAYYQQGVLECTNKGKLYGLPWGTAALYMFINTSMFESAGIPLPAMDWTWDDLEKICQKFPGNDETYGYCFGLDNVSSILPYVWSNGGDIFDKDRKKFTLDQPAAYQAIQKIVDMYKAGLMPKDSITATADIQTRWFVNNKVAMRMGSAAEILSTQKVEGVKFEVWPMPSGKSKQATVFKSNVIGISAKSKLQNQAWTFVKFLRGPEGKGETLYMKAKRMPPNIDDGKYWALYADPNKYPKMVEKNSKEIAKTYGHLLPLRPGWLEIEQTLKPVMQKIFLGEVTAEEGFKAIAPKIQEIMDRTN